MFPLLLYGLESCPLKSQITSLDLAINGALNKIFNVKSKVIIDNFGTLFNYELVYDYLVRRKMKYEILAKLFLFR